MEAFGDGPDINPDFLVQHYPWSLLSHGRGTATIVDLGGSNGSVSIALASAHPDLSFVVQDLPHVIQSMRQKAQQLPSHLVGRITWQEHDFFTPQPVAGADVYLFRYIFHNWPDSYAVRILQQLIPALKHGARVVVNDHLLPEPGTASLTTEREVRYDFHSNLVHHYGEKEAVSYCSP